MRYILAHLDIPTISSLDISAHIFDWDEEFAPGIILPDYHTPRTLFSDPPMFRIEPLRTDFAPPHLFGWN